MKINCSYDKLVEPHKLVPHPKNPNRHPEDQIKRLSEILDYQGQRSPIVVDKQTGFVVVGHGRLEAAKLLGAERVAVNYQQFLDEAQLYSHMIADNAISEWSRLDLVSINHDFVEYGPDLNVDMLGLENFKVEPLDAEVKNTNEEIDIDNFGNDLEHQCPKCGFEFND